LRVKQFDFAFAIGQAALELLHLRARELISHACYADYANSHIFHQGLSDFLLVCEAFIQFQLPRFHGESDVEFLVRAKEPLLQKTNTHVVFQALPNQTLHFGVKLRN
jgi:hypothetical protein